MIRQTLSACLICLNDLTDATRLLFSQNGEWIKEI